MIGQKIRRHEGLHTRTHTYTHNHTCIWHHLTPTGKMFLHLIVYTHKKNLYINLYVNIYPLCWHTCPYIIWGGAGETLTITVVFSEKTKAVTWQDREREFHWIFCFCFLKSLSCECIIFKTKSFLKINWNQCIWFKVYEIHYFCNFFLDHMIIHKKMLHLRLSS